jgi:hypothetical protein
MPQLDVQNILDAPLVVLAYTKVLLVTRKDVPFANVSGSKMVFFLFKWNTFVILNQLKYS